MRSISKYLLLVSLLAFLGSCKEEKYLFELPEGSQTGVTFENTITENDSLNILDYLYFYNGGGLAMGDVNNDGLPDLYFSGNQVKNKLYLNKGNLKFEDITTSGGVEGNSSWNTGAVMADVNGDGLLDIYLVAVAGINGFEGHNELFINNGDNTFTERSEEFGLDISAYGTTASFFDYDLDGDLDCYVLNHAVHTEESFGRVQLRYTRNEMTGDRLMRNDGNVFTDVSEEAGIYGGINAYGLGLAVSDFNKDGFPDIYVGNDFHEDDYFYLNNGDGTFTESLRKYFGHTSRFSMGNDVADINHDGLPDLISLDMAPEDEKVLKSSEGDDTYQTLEMRTQQYGYHYQYTRNMLFLNQGDNPYTELALLSGISATDWSWSALFGDYNQDGEEDLFISNGIPKRPNDLDFIRFVSSDEIKKSINETRLVDQKALEMMPSGSVSNYVFEGNESIGFSNKTGVWIPERPSVSGATAICDLDGDGDLDIVTNNINEPASIYVNSTNDQANYLKLRFAMDAKNSFGIGTKVEAWNDGMLRYKELNPFRGWQASSEPMIHFGLGNATSVDSLKVIWPNGTYQVLSEVKTNQTLTISPENVQPYRYQKPMIDSLFRKVEGNLGINYTHKEDRHSDFDYQKLIPYSVSDRGPALAVGDLNNDGKNDVFIGGGRNQKAGLFLQNEFGYVRTNHPKIDNDSVFEDIDAVIFKPHFTDKNQLTVVSGGNRISPSLRVLSNRTYNLTDPTREVIFESGDPNNSSVERFIIENNETYSFEGSYTKPLDFGEIPLSTYSTRSGRLVDDKIGMVTDATWDDFDGDGNKDLIVVGEWMPPTFFRNNNGQLIEENLLDSPLNGLWQSIIPFDIDKDGDMDYLLGNWGMNSKFEASQEAPMMMYYDDFDENGTTETIVATEKNGAYYPLMGLNELSAQMNFLRKKFTTYESFAGKNITEIFGEEALDKATKFEVHTLASGFLRNNGDSFTFVQFPEMLQTAPITAFEKFDFDGDGSESVLAGGNYFGVIPFHGRYDSFPGAIIDSDTEFQLANKLGLDLSLRSVRHLKVIHLNNQPYLLVINNNDDAVVYEIKR
ncbi:VCBS repeat-containing protein [Aureitalea sp. L0-47]|uniref:VCBS repeat-containing protein n=1 Tax=Aureitalea sp. L0-47 TaxID=2816962 RepID=UPI002AA2B2D6|nr:VCBS repeat-containing protein [Aureitalea sp. L0-47]